MFLTFIFITVSDIFIISIMAMPRPPHKDSQVGKLII